MQARRHFVHPQAIAQMERIAASGEPPLETLEPAEARRAADARVINNGWEQVPMHSVRELQLPGPGGELTARFYKPTADANLPLILFFHGGGFMVGNLDTHDAVCRVLASKTGAAIFSVAYRLSPEHPFPAAPDDCIAAAAWAYEHAAELGVDRDRVAVVGESSGGSLSAVVAQFAARTGKVKLLLQVLIYPSLDMSEDYNSYKEFSEGYFFTKTKSQFFRKHYMTDPKDVDDIRASPIRAKSVAGVCPALIISAGLDPLRDQAAEYAKRLHEEGVEADYYDYEGWPHGFLFWAHTEAAQRAMQASVDALRKAFNR